MAQSLHILLVPHTHWDREWYQTFQQFRFRLVQTIDKLLTILDDDDGFTHFLLDGQTIVIDDYVQVRPEQLERLTRHIRDGRISVGPWYVQPDEFLVSGESLVRNLARGLRRAAEFGTPMRVGYVPDCFGHIEQLPQVLRGVGIESAVFWRGVGSEARQSEFLWASPNGSSVFVAHLADTIGYSNARHMPLDPQEFATRTELLTATLLPKATTDTLLFMNGSDHLEPQAGLPTTIAEANALLSHIDSSHQHLLATIAHTGQENARAYDAIDVRIGTLPEYIDYVRGRVPDGELQVVRGDLRSSQYAHLLPSVLSTRMWIKQQNAANEHLLERLVEPLTAWAWTLGVDYPQGFVREAWQYLLQNHPHDSICGCSIDQVHRENATRFAQSKQVGELLVQRAVEQIGMRVSTRPPVETTHTAYQPVPILVFNMGPGPRTESIQVEVQLPGSLSHAVIVDAQGATVPHRIVNRWRQEIGTMPLSREILAAAAALNGVHSPTQFIEMAKNTIAASSGRSEESFVVSRVHIEDAFQARIAQEGTVRIEIMIAPTGRVLVDEQELHDVVQRILDMTAREDITLFEISLIDQARETLELLAPNVPAYGYTTFWLYPRGLSGNADSSHEQLSSLLLAREHSIENELYHIQVDAQDGTLTVTDKQTGMRFAGLNRFVDDGDVGDLYNYSPPEHDRLVMKPDGPPMIEIINNGPVQATLRVTGRWSLPVSCTESRAGRSAETASCTIVSDIILTMGSRRIDIHTSVDNRARDHRLRVHFPVPYTLERVAVEETFGVQERLTVHPRPANVAEWVEEPVNVFPQKRFVDASDGKTGLAVLNRGLPECEILQGDGKNGVEIGEQAIAVTLLRCVEWLSRDDLTTRRGHAGPPVYTPEAQCQGRGEFDYALVPHEGTWETNESLVLQEAQAFNIPLVSRVRDEQASAEQEQLPSHASLVEVAPAGLVVSAIRRSDDGSGVSVRVYNPTNHAMQAELRLHANVTRVYRTNLLEERQAEVALSDTGVVKPAIQMGEIATFLFT